MLSGDVLRFAPVGALHVLFAPFPWDTTGPVQAAAAIENVVLYVVTAVAVLMPGFLAVLGTRSGVFVGLVILLVIGPLAIVEGNIGTAYRHKMQILPYLLMLGVAGLPVGPDERWARDAGVADA